MDKTLMQSFVTLMTLGRMRDEHRLDLDGHAVFDAARLELERRPARELIAGILDWQRSGMVRRDPRPRPVAMLSSATAQADRAEARRTAGRL